MVLMSVLKAVVTHHPHPQCGGKRQSPASGAEDRGGDVRAARVSGGGGRENQPEAALGVRPGGRGHQHRPVCRRRRFSAPPQQRSQTSGPETERVLVHCPGRPGHHSGKASGIRSCLLTRHRPLGLFPGNSRHAVGFDVRMHAPCTCIFLVVVGGQLVCIGRELRMLARFTHGF